MKTKAASPVTAAGEARAGVERAAVAVKRAMRSRKQEDEDGGGRMSRGVGGGGEPSHEAAPPTEITQPHPR